MSRWGDEPPAAASPPPAVASRPGSPRMLLDGPAITRLVTYVGVSLGVGVFVIVGARFLSAGFFPVPTLVTAGALGVLWWALMMVTDWPAYERWEPASATDPSLRVASDARTRRLESMLSGADAKHRMSTRDVARALAAVVSDALVRHHGADPADPLASAGGRLSPDLIDFLRADPARPVPAVTRRVLHVWLTEIDTLTRQRDPHG